MTWELHKHDARHVSDLLAPESVDLIITSPPYYVLRSYRDGGKHYDGQTGNEATPTEFIDTLIACTADWLKVLKPSGSIFVNLGDKYAGSGGHNNNGLGNLGDQRARSSTLSGGKRRIVEANRDGDTLRATRRNAPDRYNQASDGVRPKSLMGLPWRYALRCIDELGLILRAEICWSKPNGLPESVTDRVRRSHEQIFHFTREGRYFAAMDEVRAPQVGGPAPLTDGLRGAGHHERMQSGRDVQGRSPWQGNPLGVLPGSVWQIPSEPLVVPDHLGVDHFAAYPSELVRRIVLGWSPSAYCCKCDEPRRPVVDKQYRPNPKGGYLAFRDADDGDVGQTSTRRTWDGEAAKPTSMLLDATITGYACACPDTTAPTRPSVVLDPFVGTGTTPAVAHHLGRHGIGIDLSADYLRLAEWRCTSDARLRAKVLDRSGIPRPADPVIDGQLDLFEQPA